MKPLSPQDRPKVIGLCVAMVFVFGLLAKTILGMMGSKNGQAPTQPAPAPPPVVATNVPTPGTGTTPTGTPPGTTIKSSLTSLNSIELGGPTDPFRRVLPDPASFNNQSAPPPNTPRPKGGGLAGAFPNPSGVFPEAPGVQTKAVPLEPPLKLDGVVTDRENYAMVTVNGKTEMYRAGSKIARLFEVVSIDEYGASFRGPGGVFRLEVGQEHAPVAAPAAAPTGFGGGLLPAPDL